MVSWSTFWETWMRMCYGANGSPRAVNAGTYTVYYRAVDNDTYIESTIGSVSVTIAPKVVDAPTITLSQECFVYNGTAKEPAVTVQDGNTKISEKEYTVSYSNNTDTGTATVTVISKQDGNYRFDASKTFTIAKAEAAVITAPAGVAGLCYTGSEQALVTAGTASGGIMEYSLDGSVWSTIAPTAIYADTYIVYYMAVGDENHQESAVNSCTVTIAKAPLTIQAQDKEIVMGGMLPEFTYTITGFVNGETESVLTSKPIVTCTADGKMVGAYEITASGAVADNYTIQYVDGVLRVALPYIPEPMPFDPIPTAPQEQGKVECDMTGQTTVSPEVSTKGDVATVEISGALGGQELTFCGGAASRSFFA